MAIIRKGDSLPAQATAGNGYVISGGRGRIKVGTGVNETYLNLSDFPFNKVSGNTVAGTPGNTAGGIHVHEDNLGGFEVLGSAFVDVELGATAAPHRLHIGSSAVSNKELLGGKGTVTLMETGEQDISVKLGTLQGTIEADSTITYVSEGSSAFFYVE